jgi:hypothetical protein
MFSQACRQAFKTTFNPTGAVSKFANAIPNATHNTIPTKSTPTHPLTPCFITKAVVTSAKVVVATLSFHAMPKARLSSSSAPNSFTGRLLPSFSSSPTLNFIETLEREAKCDADLDIISNYAKTGYLPEAWTDGAPLPSSASSSELP